MKIKIKIPFRIPEIIILIISTILFGISAGLYFWEVPLYSYLSGQGEARHVAAEKIAIVGLKKGLLLRQGLFAQDFGAVTTDLAINNYDTITTDEEGAADLVFPDKTIISLGPNAMVRVSSEGRLSATGLNHRINLEIIVGNVNTVARGATIMVQTRDRTVPILPTGSLSVNMPPAPLRNPSLPAHIWAPGSF